MTNIIVEKIEGEIERLLGELKNLTPHTEEYVGITETINKLYGTLSKEKELMLEERKQNETLKDSKIWNVAKTGVEIAGIVVPIVFYSVWMNRGLKFEEEGSFTSTTFKGLMGKFKPTK